MADKYIIRVTAGPSYDTGSHVEVPVNTAQPVHVSSEFADVDLNVRVRNYRGLPRGSPATSPYFATEPHARNNDQYSIAFRLTPKRPPPEPRNPDEAAGAKVVTHGENRDAIGDKSSSSSSSSSSNVAERTKNEDGGEDVDTAGELGAPEGISGHDLQFGNDFDRPIRDRLPPGFGTAMRIVRWWVDPGLEGDAYADEPHLYGPALSSFNVVHAGPGTWDEGKGGLCFEEGGDAEGAEWRRRPELGAPPDDAKARMKWALKSRNKDRWVWEYGRTYGLDFFNPYLDFDDFSLRLPGFSLPVIKYWDGQPLRYVLRNRATSQVLLVVLFTLHLKEDVNEDGSLKPAALQATPTLHKHGSQEADGSRPSRVEEDCHTTEAEFDEEKALDGARRTLSGTKLHGESGDTHDDDVD